MCKQEVLLFVPAKKDWKTKKKQNNEEDGIPWSDEERLIIGRTRTREEMNRLYNNGILVWGGRGTCQSWM